ncbi:MAG: efflux RND transporter periplasmic adaptor subunit [Lewinellaceae bacterium]|nr:efflux RND transporter periplasmic adaptor subunit [Lewinellaceae bacterium]
MKFFQNIVCAAMVGSLIFLTACGGNKAENAENEAQHQAHEGEAQEVALTSDQYKIAGIETSKVETRPLTGTVNVNGVLDVPPQNLVSISAPAPGFLKKSDLLQGSRVRKASGARRVVQPGIYHRATNCLEARQELIAARGQLEYAEAEYKRQEELARENVNAGKTLQAAKAQQTTLQARVAGLEAKTAGQAARFKLLGIDPDRLSPGSFQSEIRIYSPTNGYVTEVNVNSGKYVGNTEVLFKIADTEHLHAELTVFEKDILKIKVGQKVRFTLANETKERRATIYLFAREISPDRSIRVHCHLDKEDTDLLPGMYFKATIETGASPVPALPEAAIVSSEGKDYIFVEEMEEAAGPEAHEHKKGEPAHDAEKEEHDHTKGETEKHGERHFRMVEVRRGISDGGWVEVLLPEDFDLSNHRVVTKGAFYLLSASKAADEAEGGHAH